MYSKKEFELFKKEAESALKGIAERRNINITTGKIRHIY